jgi:hypothetical protein
VTTWSAQRCPPATTTIWISHGGLADNLEFSAYSNGSTATTGGRLRVRRGSNVTVVMAARLAYRPNASGSVPRLARLDLIQGPVTGPAAPDSAHADGVVVAESFEPRWWPGNTVLFKHTFRNVRAPFYVRLVAPTETGTPRAGSNRSRT